MTDVAKTKLQNRADAILEAVFPDGYDAHVNPTTSDTDIGMERAAGMLRLTQTGAVRQDRLFFYLASGDHGLAVSAVETVDAEETRAARRRAREAAVAESAAGGAAAPDASIEDDEPSEAAGSGAGGDPGAAPPPTVDKASAAASAPKVRPVLKTKQRVARK